MLIRSKLMGLLCLVFVHSPVWADPLPDKDGWYELFDGKTLDGWKAAEPAQGFKVENGLLFAGGTALSHLYYVGPVQGAKFVDFELRAEVMTKPKGNSGIIFHTQFQPKGGFPPKGFEFQINNTGSDKKFRTGALYPTEALDKAFAKDNVWFVCEIRVKGNQIVQQVGGKTTLDVTIPAGGKSGRKLEGARSPCKVTIREVSCSLAAFACGY